VLSAFSSSAGTWCLASRIGRKDSSLHTRNDAAFLWNCPPPPPCSDDHVVLVTFGVDGAPAGEQRVRHRGAWRPSTENTWVHRPFSSALQAGVSLILAAQAASVCGVRGQLSRALLLGPILEESAARRAPTSCVNAWLIEIRSDATYLNGRTGIRIASEPRSPISRLRRGGHRQPPEKVCPHNQVRL